jgi:hypothetical protein
MSKRDEKADKDLENERGIVFMPPDLQAKAGLSLCFILSFRFFYTEPNFLLGLFRWRH